MKYLKIENKQGFYWNGVEYKEVDKINKDDLMAMLSAAEGDDFELEPYDETLLANRAHQIIYENIFNKFQQFLENKEQFKRDVEKLYKDAISKYSSESPDLDF